MAELIACGIDDSAGGREALAVAAAFAEPLDATLLPVHVQVGRPGENEGAVTSAAGRSASAT